jgi:hypothetical protein
VIRITAPPGDSDACEGGFSLFRHVFVISPVSEIFSSFAVGAILVQRVEPGRSPFLIGGLPFQRLERLQLFPGALGLALFLVYAE